MLLKNLLRPYWWTIKDRFKEKKEYKDSIFPQDIRYINWWTTPVNKTYAFDEYWFSKFIKYHFGSKINKKITFYSLYGPKRFLQENNDNIKIFFSGENLSEHKLYKTLKEDDFFRIFEKKRFKDYKDYALDKMDLSLGFSDIHSEKYIQFPAWMMYLCEPDSNYKKIKDKIDFINNIKATYVINEAVNVSSHDGWGTRTKICDDISDIINIKYAGKWRNNTQDLWEIYNNNKLEYIKQFKFNICAENIDAKDYLTEKIFESFLGGCIPIYHGALNKIDSNILLGDSVIFWEYDKDNSENIKLLKKLKEDDTYYYKFFNRNKLSNEAAEYIYNKFELLKEKIEILIK